MISVLHARARVCVCVCVCVCVSCGITYPKSPGSDPSR